MKKFLTFFALAVVTLLMSSCQAIEDDRKADRLDGIWAGEVATEYFSYRYGRVTEYQYVEIEFFKDPVLIARGNGVEYDYNRNGTCTVCDFDYEVRNGRIYLYYADRSQVYMRYSVLTSNVLDGAFYDIRTGNWLADFKFDRVAYHRYRAKEGKITQDVIEENTDSIAK